MTSLNTTRFKSHDPVQLRNNWIRSNTNDIKNHRTLAKGFTQGPDKLDLQTSFASSVSFRSALHHDPLKPTETEMKKLDIYGYNSRADMHFSDEISAKEILESQASGMWRELDTHILSINNDSFDFQPKQVTTNGSDVFRTVLEEERKRRKARIEGFRKAMKMTRATLRVNDALQADAHQSDIDSDSESETPLPKSMSRGWVRLRRFVQEQRLKKKLGEGSGGWNLVSKTMHHLTDAEHGRQQLYQRYLEEPNSWREGLLRYQDYRYLFEDSGWKRRQRELMTKPVPGITSLPTQNTTPPQRSRTAGAKQIRAQSNHRKPNRKSTIDQRTLLRPHTVCR